MEPTAPHRLPPLGKSLSARLLILTILFVMVAEVLIFAPSIGRFRLVYLEERLAAGRLALLALEATPDHMVSKALERELLAHAHAHLVAIRRANGMKLMLSPEPPMPVEASFDLRQGTFFGLIGDAFATLARGDDRRIRVLGPAPFDPSTEVEIVINETPLRMAMYDYSQRILGLSILISLITAALVYLSLQWLMVRPMRRITQSMTAFRDDPEDVARAAIEPSGRTDEIGVAERELADMQARLRAALHQKSRLAALGIAVTKISHDLRGILATARLVSDRIADSEDPEVKRLTPTLLGAIDKAVDLCSKTLTFITDKPPEPKRVRFGFSALAEEVGQSLPEALRGDAAWIVSAPAELTVQADRDQLFRVLANLGRNALQAGATRVEIAAEPIEAGVRIRIADNGPGLAPRARERLFQPFAGSARPGGSGLGLAIARELVRAHGGEIRLIASTGEGTAFELEIPEAGSQKTEVRSEVVLAPVPDPPADASRRPGAMRRAG
ncbi:MAG TPA: HAMP domain-containing sensor histidine kinase [Methylomirabilota bacterium]|jgi:signal transduction histidine kinase|nr:HAMP domain-containing sensor histidine kinase [Methylomirabilota bacterium]